MLHRGSRRSWIDPLALPPPQAETDIYVADTVGELGLIYRLAPVVFIGAVGGEPFRLLSDSTPVRWRALARDGAGLPDELHQPLRGVGPVGKPGVQMEVSPAIRCGGSAVRVSGGPIGHAFCESHPRSR